MSSVSCILVLILILVSILIDSANAILSDQYFFIESKRDIGTIYSLEIIADTKTMTLTMEGPQNIWMGVSLGAEDMFNVTAYVYYFDDDNNKWVFAERYLMNEEGPGEVIEIIDKNNYDISNENGTTRIIFTRAWIGTHSKSFTLSNDDREFHYGFARGISGILSYHQRDGRSHSVYTLIHNNIDELDFNCSHLNRSECIGKIDDEGDQLCGYNTTTQDCYPITITYDHEIIRLSYTKNISLFNWHNNTLKDILIIILAICCVTICVICIGVYFHRKPNQIPHQQIISAEKDDDINLVTLVSSSTQKQDQTVES